MRLIERLAIFAFMTVLCVSASAADDDAHAHHHPATPVNSADAAIDSAQAHAAHAAQTDLSAEQRQRLTWELEQLATAVGRYKDFKAAEADGWVRFGSEDTPLMGEHWYREGAREPLPSEPLNFSEPTTLQYALVNGRRELVGVSYNIRIAPDDALPEGFTGSEDHWHIHDVEKILAAATEDRPFLGWLAKAWIDRDYRSKGDNRSRMAMAHAWVVIPNPDGMFAMHNRVIPYLRAGLPAAFADGADEAAANGVNLAAPKACANSLDGGLWIAHATSAQRKALHRTCDTLAKRMQAVVTVEKDPAVINAAGRAAWQEFEAAQRAELTGKQLARIAAMTEH